MSDSISEDILTWLTRRGGRVRMVEESLLQAACHEIGWRHHGTAAQERLRRMLYEMAARRQIVMEFHAEDPSRIVMICLAEVWDEAIQLETARRQIHSLHGAIAELRTQLQSAAPDSAAALQLAQEAEDERQLTEDRLVETQRQLNDLRATLDEEIRLARAAHPRAQDQRRISKLTHQVDVLRDAHTRDLAEVKRLKELTATIPGYQAHIRQLIAAYERVEVHQLICGCTVARVSNTGCTFVPEGERHPWFPIVIPGVTDPQEGYAMLARILAGHSLRSGEETLVIMNDTQALGQTKSEE